MKKQALVPEQASQEDLSSTDWICTFRVLFFLSSQGYFSFYKPRRLVYKDQKDCTDISITLMATLYYITCSGSLDEYTHVHGRAKTCKATLSSQGFRQWAQTQNSTVHMHRKEKGFLERKTNTLCYPSRQILF